MIKTWWKIQMDKGRNNFQYINISLYDIVYYRNKKLNLNLFNIDKYVIHQHLNFRGLE